MKKILTIVALAVFGSILALSGCGDNWLDNGPTAYIKSINIEGDGSGSIQGVALGQVHTVFIGIDSKDVDKLQKAEGAAQWTFSVTGLSQGVHSVYVCAASGSAYGKMLSWSFELESEGYEKVFEGLPDPSSSSAAASSSSSGETDQNYDFDGNIANLRNAITSPTDQNINVTVTGIVHACKSAGRFWIQDKTAGIYVYKNGGDAPTVGSKVTLTATKGQVYNNLKEVKDYKDYSLVSSGNQVYRQTGVPTADKQGQAWATDSVVVDSSWNDKSNITVGGVTYRNDSGAEIAAGTYRIQGPVSQYNNNVQILVYSDGAIAQGSSSASSVASSSSASAASTDPHGSWAQDGAKPANQRPFNNYYAAAYGKTGAELKAALKTIISTGTKDLGYDGLYSIYPKSDKTDDGKVWDIYSDRDGTGMNRPYTFSHGIRTCGQYSGEGECYNREHMIPQSKFRKARPMVSDAHHVLPTDGKVNGLRSSFPHAEVANATTTTLNGSKLGKGKPAQGFSGTCFEPIDPYKGDTARIYFYFSLRYNGGNTVTWESMSAGARLKSWAQTLYRKWHAADPVSKKERDRNNAVQEFQKNRNPFIDYPELAEMIDFTN